MGERSTKVLAYSFSSWDICSTIQSSKSHCTNSRFLSVYPILCKDQKASDRKLKLNKLTFIDSLINPLFLGGFFIKKAGITLPAFNQTMSPINK